MARWSRPCYDKRHRCPGWAGGGWAGARQNLCPDTWDGQSAIHSGYLDIDYESRWWMLRINTCDSCGVKVLPDVVRWTSWRTWWYSIRFARNSWLWLIKLENRWGKKRGKW